MLDREELERQLRFIKWHLDIGSISTVFVLIREWIVSRCVLFGDKSDNWLKNTTRDEIEWLLNDKNRKQENNVVTDWIQLTQLRNGFAHAGMGVDKIDVDTAKKIADKVYNRCLENLNNDDFWRLKPIAETVSSVDGSVGGEKTEKVLVSPMGASVGLLYSALMLTKPDRVIVLTSEKFKDRVSDVCEKASFSDMSKVSTSVINDPFSGFDESERLVSEVSSLLSDSSECIVNFTGGTTAMQWAMQAIYEKLHNDFKDSSANLTRVAFIDRRPSTEQQSDPYRVGEMVNIDKI